MVNLNRGRVRLRPLVLSVASVEHTLDCAVGGFNVHALVPQIVRDPAAVDEDGAGLAVSIQVSVEGSNDLETLLATVVLANLDFTLVVEDASHSHGLHRELLLELGKVLGLSPGEATLVGRRNVNGSLIERFPSTGDLRSLIFSGTLLVVSKLINENDSGHSSQAEHNLLLVHFY